MCIRLLELHRVIKPTGSLYLHCDPTASHCLKIVLDGVFGPENFRTEISWKRSSAHNDAKQGREQYGNVRDVLFFYSKSSEWRWNWLYMSCDSSYPTKNYRHIEAASSKPAATKATSCSTRLRLRHGVARGARTAAPLDRHRNRALRVSLIERRLKEAFPGIAFDVHGTPTDIAAARDLAERDKHQFQLWACGLVNAQPYQGGRKGADRDIDGLLYIEVSKNQTEKMIVQVNGGANVMRAKIATLKGDLDRENAAVGLFITLAEPTREMLRESTAAGHFETPHFGAVPKFQILTVADLLAGKKPQLPDLSRGEQTFKKARREERDGTKHQPGFDF